MQQFLAKIPSLLKNKYLLCVLVFAVWMVFFDDRDIITTQFRYKRELNSLQESKAFFEARIAETRIELGKLQADPVLLEKYAREKYHMKRDNEDLYIIADPKPE
jgi:cell division protein DivIC